MAKDAASAALLKPVAKSDNRNVFPLDNRQIYTMKAGQITPVKVQHFMPGDHFEIKASDFTITFPMNTAAFMRGRKEFSFYSVYYSAIWSQFNQYMATREDPKTSAFLKNAFANEPRVRLSDLYMSCLFQWSIYLVYKYHYEVQAAAGTNIANSNYIFDRFKAGTFSLDFNSYDITYQNTGGTSVTDTWYWWTKPSWGSQWIIAVDQTDFLPQHGFTNVVGDNVLDMTGHFRVYSWVRKLDMLGYGNLYPLLRKLENEISAWVTQNGELTQARLDVSMTEAVQDVLRMCYTYDGTFALATNLLPKYVNIYSICAYNLVFYHFFRNSFYDLNYDPRDYNLDFAYIDNGYSNGIIRLSNFSRRFLDIEYHQWKKDLFTSVLPDTQFGAVSTLDISGTLYGINDGYPRALSKEPSGKVVLSSSLTNGSAPAYWSNSNSSFSIPSAFDVIALKRAEMLQQYRQTLMRAGNKTSDIFKALYGGAPSSEHEDDVIPRFLSTFGEDISVDPVVATATTGAAVNGELGDLSARGRFRGDGQQFKLNVGKNFGCIIALAYVVPTSEYNSYLLDAHNLELSPEQHFLPAYENFGLEAVYSDELNMLIPANQTKVLGYASRYHHKKTALDLVHGAFCSVPQSVFSALHGGYVLYNTFQQDFFGDFNHWVSPRSDMQSLEFSRLSDFYINPSILDNVFVRAAGADIADDQFICTTFFEIRSTRALSKVGLINFV